MAAGTARSGKEEPDIGSSAGHGYYEKGSKRKKESKLPSEAAATTETVKIIKQLSPLENCNRCHKTVSGDSL